jgi:hypothetical protein
MKFEMNDVECEALREVLESYLSELRVEIAHTDVARQNGGIMAAPTRAAKGCESIDAGRPRSALTSTHCLIPDLRLPSTEYVIRRSAPSTQADSAASRLGANIRGLGDERLGVVSITHNRYRSGRAGKDV